MGLGTYITKGSTDGVAPSALWKTIEETLDRCVIHTLIAVRTMLEMLKFFFKRLKSVTNKNVMISIVGIRKLNQVKI